MAGRKSAYFDDDDFYDEDDYEDEEYYDEEGDEEEPAEVKEVPKPVSFKINSACAVFPSKTFNLH